MEYKEIKKCTIALTQESLGKVFMLCLGAYYSNVYTKTMMDSIIKVQASDKNILEKLKFIYEATEETEEELYHLLPTVPIPYQGEYHMVNTLEDTELKYLIAKAILPYIKQVQERYTQQQETELFEIGSITKLIRNLMTMVEILGTRPIYNRTHKMELLLDIIDAVLARTARFWEKWRYEAEEIAHNLPLNDILEVLHKDGSACLDAAFEKMLPEVVSSFLLYYREEDLFLYHLHLLANDEDSLFDECELEGYKRVLERLEQGQLLDKNIPLEEQLSWLNNEIVLAAEY